MKKHVTILFDANPLMGNRSGVGYYTTQVIEALAKEYPKTTFVGYFYNFLGRKPRPSAPIATNVFYRPIYLFPGPVVNLLRRYHILLPVEALTLMKADFIFYSNFLGLSSIFRTPSANVIHDLTYIDLPDYVAKKNLSDLRHFIPGTIHRASFLVTVSQFAQRRIQEEFSVPAADILVTPIPPSAPTVFSETKRKKLLEGLHLSSKYFLTLSTIEPRKNVLAMLEAYLLLPDELQKEYTFVITGAIGWNCEAETARLEELKKAGKNIVHLGYVTEEQRSALYQGATFYTSASHYEGFGMTPLEAMSYGKPCALSNIPVFREVTKDAALYFDQARPEAIEKAWLRLINDQKLHENLSRKAKQRADSYKWSEVAESLYSRITQTLDQNPGPAD